MNPKNRTLLKWPLAMLLVIAAASVLANETNISMGPVSLALQIPIGHAQGDLGLHATTQIELSDPAHLTKTKSSSIVREFWGFRPRFTLQNRGFLALTIGLIEYPLGSPNLMCPENLLAHAKRVSNSYIAIQDSTVPEESRIRPADSFEVREIGGGSWVSYRQQMSTFGYDYVYQLAITPSSWLALTFTTGDNYKEGAKVRWWRPRADQRMQEILASLRVTGASIEDAAKCQEQAGSKTPIGDAVDLR